MLADFIESWNKHDTKAFSMVFVEDADFNNVRGASAHGRTSRSFTRHCSRQGSRTRIRR